MSSEILRIISKEFEKKSKELNNTRYNEEATMFTLEGLQEIGLRSIIYKDVSEIIEEAANEIQNIETFRFNNKIKRESW